MGITVASSYYINNSNPSPYHSSSGASDSSDAPPTSFPTIQHNAEEPENAPAPAPSPSPPTPPQALVFLTSSKTRQGLSIAHAITAEAVKVTSKTVELVDGMIEKVIAGSDTRTLESTPRPSQPLSPGPSLPEPTGPETLTPTLRADTTSDAQPQVQLSIKDSLLISADLVFSTLGNSTQRAFQVGTEQFGKIVNHKYTHYSNNTHLSLIVLYL